MSERKLPHIVVPTPPERESFTLVGPGGGVERREFSGDREEHGIRLEREFRDALRSRDDNAEVPGTFITFASFPGLELAIESLESLGRGDQPKLVNVREKQNTDAVVIEATVYIPHGKRGLFLKKLEKYRTSVNERGGKVSNAALIEGIASIRRATIRELWTDPDDEFPQDENELCWWEVWLRKAEGGEQRRFSTFAEDNNLKMSENYLGFGDQTVMLVQAKAVQLARAFDAVDDIAELRRPRELSNLLPSLCPREQKGWVEELQMRLEAASNQAPVACILDRGVQGNHPLLEASITVEDHHVADPTWDKDITMHSHGTEMAGLALYGDLQAAILSDHVIRLRHRLESVKILPDRGANDPDVYGAIMARGVDQAEIASPERKRVFMLAITAENPTRVAEDGRYPSTVESGRPTAWSATIDALAFGRAIDDNAGKFTYLDRDEEQHTRLFIVSAGNIRDVRAEDDHLDRCDAEAVEDPAQAWNALTVGAISEHDAMDRASPSFAGYVPIAARGELSPTSRTSVSFDPKRWPFKPDVVAPGGNLARTPDRLGVDSPENLAILTTRLQEPGRGYFTTTRDTSAATAQVAAIAADICAEHPKLRAETVRALVVHSAEWTDAMRQHLGPAPTKADKVNLLRRYGMGVPSLERATRSATNALTLIAESIIHPYKREGQSSRGSAREMNLHRLPWPNTQLTALGETKVKLRVTLSYFVEPNPSSRGWSGRYVYPSHGLRFVMKRPEDSVDSFRQRINRKARDNGLKPLSLDTEAGWFFGRNQQTSPGSLHTDIWTGSAADLASKGEVIVYPVGGWWKNRPQMDQSDKGVPYSIIVSIESPILEVDLWTPVAQQISTLITV